MKYKDIGCGNMDYKITVDGWELKDVVVEDLRDVLNQVRRELYKAEKETER